jgi:hypothetical protein
MAGALKEQAARGDNARRRARPVSEQTKRLDLRVGKFVGQGDRHLGQPEFAGGFKPEVPVNNRAVGFGHDRDPKAEFSDRAGHLIDDGVVLAETPWLIHGS